MSIRVIREELVDPAGFEWPQEVWPFLEAVGLDRVLKVDLSDYESEGWVRVSGNFRYAFRRSGDGWYLNIFFHPQFMRGDQKMIDFVIPNGEWTKEGIRSALTRAFNHQADHLVSQAEKLREMNP